MIIQCINCNKIFEVDSSLIPEAGREIQCGSCNHIWFYKHINKSSSSNDLNKEKEENIKKNEVISKAKINRHIGESTYKNSIEKQKRNSPLKSTKSTIFTFNKLLSYTLVGIISFISLIILLDTFKSPLYSLYPDLELLLYNLFETIKDIFLFFKDLIE